MSDITKKPLLWPMKLLIVQYETGICVTCLGTWQKEKEEGFEAVQPVGIVLEDCIGRRDPNLSSYWKQSLVCARCSSGAKALL